MDDSGGAVSGGGSAAPASSSDHEYSSHGAAQPISIPKSNSASNLHSNLHSKSSEKIYNISSGMMSTPMHDRSRKSTLSKSAFEVTVNGLDVPEDHDHHHETRSRHRIEFDGYFVGPIDLDRHSKWPYFMRMQGSVVPRMVVPIFCIGVWTAIITWLAVNKGYKIGVNQLLLTVMGFVVAFTLSFRTSTAYERYSDGRKCWATLMVQSRNLARYIWFHIDERPGADDGKDDILAKLSAINLILAFAVALKHRLRFEPYAHYEDIDPLTSHLDTFARAAWGPEIELVEKKVWWKEAGEYLGLPFAEDNPRRAIKRASRPLGNLPLEILNYLSAYADEQSVRGTLKSPIVYGQILTSLSNLCDTMASAERVLTTPLPAGYNILISQIVLLYVYLLPFQLVTLLGWITVPATVAAAYMIIGLAAIGHELEDPFGNDVNDLPLDHYCDELRRELDVLTSREKMTFSEMMKVEERHNRVLWPLSMSGHDEWRQRKVQDIRSALKAKVVVGQSHKQGRTASEASGKSSGASSGISSGVMV